MHCCGPVSVTSCTCLSDVNSLVSCRPWWICSYRNQWLNCMKRSWGTLPSTSIPFSFSPSLHSRSCLPLACCKAAHINQLRNLGSTVSTPTPSRVWGEAWPQKHFFVIWARKLHLAATFLLIYFSLKWCIFKHKAAILTKSAGTVFRCSKKVVQCCSGAFRLNLSTGHNSCNTCCTCKMSVKL